MLSNSSMFMKYFIYIGTLWSCLSAVAAELPGFVTVDKSYKTIESSSIPKEMLPRCRSQDSLPACNAMAAATVAQAKICKVRKVPDCSDISPKDEISPLSMVAWLNTNKGGGINEFENHTNIQLFKGTRGASDGLKNSAKDFVFFSDSCYPFDQLSSVYGDFKREEVENVVGVMAREYRKFKTEGSLCDDCLLKSAREFNIKAPLSEIKSALENDTFGQFLFAATLGNCDDAVDASPSPKFENFPLEKKDFKYEPVLNKVKSLLKTNTPMALDGVCLKYSAQGKCLGYHAVVITGYRKVCKGTGTSEKCRDVFRVQNSWGKDWQKEFDDGWVDAKELLSAPLREPSNMKGMLSWYS